MIALYRVTTMLSAAMHTNGKFLRRITHVAGLNDTKELLSVDVVYLFPERDFTVVFFSGTFGGLRCPFCSLPNSRIQVFT